MNTCCLKVATNLSASALRTKAAGVSVTNSGNTCPEKKSTTGINSLTLVVPCAAVELLTAKAVTR
jgi:hypothetical protein